MSIAAGLVLLSAMRAKLVGDAALVGLVGGAYVFDAVPPATREPYVALGDIQSRDWSTRSIVPNAPATRGNLTRCSTPRTSKPPP